MKSEINNPIRCLAFMFLETTIFIIYCQFVDVYHISAIFFFVISVNWRDWTETNKQTTN